MGAPSPLHFALVATHRGIWAASLVASAHTALPTWVVAGLIWSAVGIVVQVLAALCFLEAITYFLRQDPITFYVRTAFSTNVVVGFILAQTVYTAAVMGFTHFIVDVARKGTGS